MNHRRWLFQGEMVVENVHESAQMAEEEVLENRRSGELWVQQDTADSKLETAGPGSAGHSKQR